ncbi:hypothetical protein LCGC14_1604050 [marine sediment metagenome]|uniref:Uncharacterized protein n=1 Tax=marine sediment metagenome TaxID=412755 RepID=A0A0F9KR49_9ZZZZ
MKYHFEGFLIGLGMFWLMTFLAYLENITILKPYYYFGLPILFWIIWSMLESMFVKGEENEK